jgi:hypothetical protein
MNREYWERAFKEIEDMLDEEFIDFIEMQDDLEDVFMIMKEEVRNEN